MGGFGSFLGGIAQVAAAGTQGMVEGEREVRARKEKDRAFKLQEDQFALYKRDADASYRKLMAQRDADAEATYGQGGQLNWGDNPYEPKQPVAVQGQVGSPVPPDVQNLATNVPPAAGMVQQQPPAAPAQVAFAAPVNPKDSGKIQTGIAQGKSRLPHSPEAYMATAYEKRGEYLTMKAEWDKSVAAAKATGDNDKLAALNAVFKRDLEPIYKEAINNRSQADQARSMVNVRDGFMALRMGDKESAQKLLAPVLGPEVAAKLEGAKNGKFLGIDVVQVYGKDGKVVYQAPPEVIEASYLLPPEQATKVMHDWSMLQARLVHEDAVSRRAERSANRNPLLEIVDKLKKLDVQRANMKEAGKYFGPDGKTRTKEADILEFEALNTIDVSGIGRNRTALEKNANSRSKEEASADIRRANAVLQGLRGKIVETEQDKQDRAWAMSILKQHGAEPAEDNPILPDGSGGSPPRTLGPISYRPLGSNS